MHQTIRITTITVVICMMRSAFSLDSWMPMIFLRQKYTVTAAAKTAAKYGGLTCRLGIPSRGAASLIRPPR